MIRLGLMSKLRDLLQVSPSAPSQGSDRIAPFGDVPHADRDTYLTLHAKACAQSYPEVETYERESGIAIDRDWMEELALHTQCVVKKNPLNYGHGRILYSALRSYLKGGPDTPVTIFETGSARGFSSVVMARALADAEIGGSILTLDRLPHHTPMIWNCIDDNDGPKSRAEILEPWEPFLRHIAFLEGNVSELLRHIGLSRVNFAFLDATHEEQDVMEEYHYVAQRQKPGDMIIFDDVTPHQFPGVVAAIDKIEAMGLYQIQRITASELRGYAIGTRAK